MTPTPSRVKLAAWDTSMDTYCSPKDISAAERIARLLYPDEGTRRAFLTLAWHLTLAKLLEPATWAAVEALAHVFEESRRVPGDVAKAIIETALHSPTAHACQPPAAPNYETDGKRKRRMSIDGPSFLRRESERECMERINRWDQAAETEAAARAARRGRR